MLLRAIAVGLVLTVAAPIPLIAQNDQSLADIRLELTALYRDIQGLRSELTSSGQAGQGVAGATPLDRLNAMEQELQRLTSKTEELEFRVDRIVRDGTNRVGDLEFRLCELEPGCDIGALGRTPSLGGVDSEPSGPIALDRAPGGPALAVAEQEDFDRAGQALEDGDFRTAADLLASFGQTYPGSPVAAEAHFMRGQAYEQLGEMANAARGYLESFSSSPEGPIAPQALTKLGRSLAALGQQTDACITLGEVGLRFPGDPAVQDAQSAMQTIGCG